MELGMGLVDVRYAVDAFAAEPSHVFDELCT